MFLEIEQAVVAQLTSEITGVQILAFPSQPADLGRVVALDTLYVGISDCSYSAPTGNSARGGNRNQQRTYRIEVVLRMSDSRSHQRVYPVLDEVIDALAQFEPLPEQSLGYSLLPVRAGFMDFSRGLWLYSVTFDYLCPYSRNNRSL